MKAITWWFSMFTRPYGQWSKGASVGANDEATVEVINEYLHKNVAETKIKIIEMLRKYLPPASFSKDLSNFRKEYVSSYDEGFNDCRNLVEEMIDKL